MFYTNVRNFLYNIFLGLITVVTIIAVVYDMYCTSELILTYLCAHMTFTHVMLGTLIVVLVITLLYDIGKAIASFLERK